ncbi:MAG: ABC transporter permease subunit [Eubacteriales bacterium]|nr:ABC transporter permease subunit [Eubacteriales bacterium]
MKKKTKLQKTGIIKSFRTQRQLWLICLFALVWAAVFCYVPMLGNIIAFFDYVPGRSLFDCKFIGLKNWIDFFSLPDMWRVFRNTLVISGLNMTIGFTAPILFALLLNEIHHTVFKKAVQTISYLPYFISWVVVASILMTLLGTEGNINEILMRLGITEQPIAFLNEKNMFWGILTSANIWKDLGWSAIIYISAIAGVDQELYQAGAVDGLGRFGKVWHITLPGIAPTIILLFIMNIGNILNAGFEQQLLIGTPLTKEVYENIDTYVYRYGVQIGRYSFATAVGLLKSVIGFALVVIANKISGKVADMRLF